MRRTTYGRTPNRETYPARLATMFDATGARTWEAWFHDQRGEGIRGSIAQSAATLEQGKRDFNLRRNFCGHAV